MNLIYILLFCCANLLYTKNTNINDETKQKDSIQIRVINKTDYKFSNVSLFSMKFNDLNPRDTSAYKWLKYNPLVHDPLIYCISDEMNYARYLKIPKIELDKYTYVIDSIQNRIIHISEIIN